jgi:medium-chain acyl-[acyl-carrier-protein] hydrolase
MSAPNWFRLSRSVRNAKLRLICLPHAGAGASIYSPWATPLAAAQIELRAVQYPGREDRIAETPIGSWRELVSALADNWLALSAGKESALFGHSMGAMLAFELALELRRRGAAENLVHVFVSGRNPPHIPKTTVPVHELPEERFLTEFIKRYQAGFPAELLADHEIMALLSPILRADCRVVETYAWTDRAPLNVPLSVFGGTNDPWTSREALEAWRGYTADDFALRMFAGDHYFHQNTATREAVVASVCEALNTAPVGRAMPCIA